MEQINFLIQHITDVQNSLAAVKEGPIDPLIIQKLDQQMSQIEQILDQCEQAVAIQKPRIQRIEEIINEITTLHELCQTIPVDLPQTISETKITSSPFTTSHPLVNQGFFESNSVYGTASQYSSAQISNSNFAPVAENTTQKNNDIQHTPKTSKTNNSTVFIEPFTSISEYSGPATTLGLRLKLEEINEYVNEINTILRKKISILKLKPNSVRSYQKELWERYKNEELPDDNRLFFTELDLKDAESIRKKQKQVLALFRSLGKIKSETKGKICRYFIQPSN